MSVYESFGHDGADLDRARAGDAYSESLACLCLYRARAYFALLLDLIDGQGDAVDEDRRGEAIGGDTDRRGGDSGEHTS